jgi:hypothetical protein
MPLSHRHRAAAAPSLSAPPVPAPVPAAVDDWRRAIDALDAAARHCVQKRRDGDDAACHAEIRRRMRALARAARRLAGPAAG